MQCIHRITSGVQGKQQPDVVLVVCRLGGVGQGHVPGLTAEDHPPRFHGGASQAPRLLSDP